MIRLISALPEIQTLSAEYVRMKCLFDAYKDDENVLFWEQGAGQAFFSLADGDMTIYNPSGEMEEMMSFLHMMAPKTVFSDAKTLNDLGLTPYQRLAVLCRKADLPGQMPGDILNSKELYDLFSKKGLILPEYPHFAVDFCRRLNHGCALYFGKKDACAAVALFSGEYALLTGIASLKKGFGTVALQGILQKNHGRTVIACCEESLNPFYLKSGFQIVYDVGSWKNEHS